MLPLPAAIHFKVGKGDTSATLTRPIEKFSDGQLTALLLGGSRKYNDYRNTLVKPGTKLPEGLDSATVQDAEKCLDWWHANVLGAERGPRAERQAAELSPIAEAILTYVRAKRSGPSGEQWKAAEKARWSAATKDGKTRVKAVPGTLEELRGYLATLNSLTAFPDNAWAGVSGAVKTMAQEIEATRAKLAKETETSEGAEMLF
jgi:hypothetical protein